MSELLPCPFCEAALVWSDTYSEYHHPIAKCILSGHKFKKGMIGQWNRRALPAVQPGKEVMPDVSNDAPNAPDAAPASTAYAGGGAEKMALCDAIMTGMGALRVTHGGATREEVAEALWRVDQYRGQVRINFADIESYNRNHWLKLADVAIKTIKGEKK